MTSLKRTKLWAASAGRTDALTAAWKKAFDARIRTAALSRDVAPRRSRAKTVVPANAGLIPAKLIPSS
ncbi:hypothetical protein [Roseicyclus mahoneyensis]|uniref:Uncharacterized protein n=1 Tax=Roseicyclus mahoneyensis TaxID=164332 RepID=A0A316GME9_9RHOB|nr:hypothetical protein [Roseicyclus mahoneyensis]PWK62347.1 hypothetical protein C7455_101373 [Roseicyclus mahoneyensis]